MADKPTDRLAAFGNELSRLRQAREWTLEGVAGGLMEAGVNVTYQAVRKWEAGEAEPSRDKVLALENLYGIERGQLSSLLGYLPLGVDPAGPAPAGLSRRWSDLSDEERAKVNGYIDAVIEGRA